MHMEKIEIKGLKCYGPNTTKWMLGEESHLPVGPANAGKSTLASAIFSAIHASYSPEDFYAVSPPATLSVSATFYLSQADAEKLTSEIFGRYQPASPEFPADLWRWLADELFSSLEFRAEARLGVDQTLQTDISVISRLLVQDDSSNVIQVQTRSNGPQIERTDFLNRVGGFLKNRDRKESRIDDFLEHDDTFRIVSNKGLQDAGSSLIKDRVRVLGEVRARPANRSNDSMETWDGSNLGCVLGAMSAGKPSEKHRYDSIKSSFEALMQPMQLYPWRQEDKWVLGFLVPGIPEPLPASAVGMGTVEILLLITNLASSQGRIIVVEEPELHLHPPAQRALQQSIDEATTRNQILIVTHSRDIVNADGNYRLTRLQPGIQPLQIESHRPEDLSSISPSWVREYLKDALFASSVVLVEGPYDQLTIQNLMDILLPDWRAKGIVVVPVDGKKSVLKPFQYLKGLGLKVFVCLDNDALTKTDSGLTIDGEKIPICASLKHAYRCGMIDEQDYDDIKAAGKAVGPGSEYSGEFIDRWRAKLAEIGWVVLSSELDHLILTAAGLVEGSERSPRSAKRQAEVASRSISKPESTEGRPWGQPLKKPAGAPLNLG